MARQDFYFELSWFVFFSRVVASAFWPVLSEGGIG
jgi:hypothetical protein